MNSQPNYRNCVQHRTLRNLRQAEQYVAGTNYELLLEMGVTKHAGSRNVILSFDGMSIKDGLFYDRFSGDLKGMEEIGDLVSWTKERMGDDAKLQVAKECMQLMATTEDGKLRVPFSSHTTLSTGSF